MLHGVIFDMDGVLVDSGAAHHESWRILARRFGIEVSETRFKATFGQPSRDIVRLIWGEVSDHDVRRHDAEKEAIYRDLVRGHVPLMPGARDLLARLRAAGLVLAVATSGPPENLELVLREGGLADYFAATVHAFDIQHGKPAPDCFLLAAERIGLPQASCIVVEDAPVGIRAGVAAGMKVIALAGTHPPELLVAAGAAQVVARLSAITPERVLELLR